MIASRTEPSTASPSGAASAARRQRLALLSRASLDELDPVWSRVSPAPVVETLRGPEAGLVMARGRIGGTGEPFNVGEVLVSRATVRLALDECRVIGVGHVLGDDTRRAWLAAALDALAEAGDPDGEVTALLGRVRERLDSAAAALVADTEATRVDFFTLVRGDD